MKNKAGLDKNSVVLVSKEKEEAYFEKVMKNKKAQEAYNEAEVFYHFVKQIKRVMKKEHLTYYSVAKKAGINHQVVAKILNGADNAEVSTLSKVAYGAGGKLDLVFFKT
jgi:DNA-binding phage protein